MKIQTQLSLAVVEVVFRHKLKEKKMNRRNILALLAGIMIFPCGLILAQWTQKEGRPIRRQPTDFGFEPGDISFGSWSNYPLQHRLDYRRFCADEFDKNNNGKLDGKERKEFGKHNSQRMKIYKSERKVLGWPKRSYYEMTYNEWRRK